VNVGLSSSATVPPTSWTAASVSGTGWTAAITPSAAGTFYIWAELAGAPGVTAVSGAVTISAGSSVAFVMAPQNALASAAVGLNGTVSNSGAAVQVGWSTSNTVAPTSWTAMTVSGTAWSGNLVAPSTAGTYYIWAEETSNTAVQAVSGAVTVGAASSNIAQAYTYGSPAFTGMGFTNFAASQTHGASNVIFAVAGTLTGSEVANAYMTPYVPTSEPGSGGAAMSNYSSSLTVYENIPSTPGTYYLSAWRRATSGGTLEAVFVSTAITVT
jgi:hypothetical protein